MFTHNKIVSNFIVLEGLDGSGTTTQKQMIASHLIRENIPCYLTSEPTNLSIGKFIRNILASKESVERSTLARLFAADRSEHLHGKSGILQACADNKLVICDRYLFSSLAYQGYDIGIEQVWELNKNFPLPGILFFLDIEPLEAEHRYETRSNLEIYENKAIQEEVGKNYTKILAELTKTSVEIHHINAMLPIEKVFTEIWKILSDHPIVKE